MTIKINGQTIEPARLVKVNDELVTLGDLAKEWQNQRNPAQPVEKAAPDIATLITESPAELLRRARSGELSLAEYNNILDLQAEVLGITPPRPTGPPRAWQPENRLGGPPLNRETERANAHRNLELLARAGDATAKEALEMERAEAQFAKSNEPANDLRFFAHRAPGWEITTR